MTIRDNNINKRLITILITIMAGLSCQSQTIVINELMQSNVNFLMVDNDFPDSWVELYNPFDEDVNIKGYYIGVSNKKDEAYIIPCDCIISSKGYTIIYCDKVNEGLHTNFRIDSGKGDLFLFDDSGDIIDQIHFSKMPAPNIAYGRITDGFQEWHYEQYPSAGEANTGKGAKEVLPDPIFSLSGGVYDAPVTVTITIPNVELPEDTRLYITLDGKEPDENSMSGDSFSFDISESTVIRAKLISKEALIKPSLTHSYIFHHYETTLPIISLVSDNDYFYSDEYGILIGGDNDKATNCYQGWRRPVNAEFFDLRDGQEIVFNQLCETMVAGNYSRAYPQKSMKLYANRRFGAKRFEGNFWKDKPNVKKVKSFMLRNGGTACLYGRINDALIQKVFGTHLPSLDWQASQPVILYINGKYKGVFNMRERSDEDYVESNYDGLEDIELHNESQKYNVYCNTDTRKNTLFEDFYNCYSKPDVTYQEVCSMMDVDNFMNAFISEMFSTNYDYPHNNISVWRNKTDDGLWRWILKDLDYAGLRKPVTYNMFNYMFQVGNPDGEDYKDASRVPWTIDCQQLYRIMMGLPEFREKFINHFAVYLGDFLKPSITIPLIEKMKEEIYDEINPTFSAYSDFSKWYCGGYENFSDYDSVRDPLEHYNRAVNEIIQFWNDRPRILYQQIADFFNLGSIVKLNILTNNCEVKLNEILLLEGDYDGFCFSNREFNLKCMDGYGWNVLIKYDNGTENSVQIDNNEVKVYLPNYYSAGGGKYITEVVCEVMQLVNIINVEDTDSKDGKDKLVYGLDGVRMSSEKKGINVIKKKYTLSRKMLIN